MLFINQKQQYKEKNIAKRIEYQKYIYPLAVLLQYQFYETIFIGNIEIKTPIIQGGMGVGISLSGLASAVANEGGIGVISCAGLGLLYPKGKGDYTENAFADLKKKFTKPAKNERNPRSEHHGGSFQLCRNGPHSHKRKIDVVFAGAGLPLDLPLYLTPESKTKLVPIVSSSRAAK